MKKTRKDANLDFIIIVAQIVITTAAAIGCVAFVCWLLDTAEPVQKKPAEALPQHVQPPVKDWFLDSTLTEAQHIYYETQYKMK